MLDFDDTTLETVLYWARTALSMFRLEGFIIRESSENNHHVVFNSAVTWTENMSIVASIALQSGHKGLTKWFLLQARKKSMTLRWTPKGDKPSPIIVHREGKPGGQIKKFLSWERICKELEIYFNSC